MSTSRLAAGGLLGALAVLPASGVAQELPAPLARFVQQAIGLSPTEMTAVSSGEPVAKLLDAADPREVAVFGIVHVGVPRAFYMRRAVDLPAALREPSRHGLGLFSDPATIADVAAITLSHEDVAALAACQPGSCRFKLATEDISAARGINPASPSADSSATGIVRSRMVAYVNGYRALGNAALVEYGDQRTRTAAAEVFRAMVGRSPYLYAYAPSLGRYLENLPRDRPPGIREALFWADDELPGLQRTLTITHHVIYDPPEQPGVTLIVSKLLYADHYLDGALTLTAVVDAGAPGADVPALYLVLLRRLHFDNLPSGGLMNVRGRVTGRLRDATVTWLRDARSRSEADRAAKPQ